ncbi:MAG TPA: hypothetical protein VKU60_12010, partial [Chloroflexota bacterium]|nr:hypothetical protein [Chloroflexota bacterium]
AIAERSRAEALGDVTILRTELAREQPRRSIIAATLSTLGDLSSIASLVMQLQPLLQPWLGG